MTGTRRLRLLVVFATVAVVLTAGMDGARRSPLLDVDHVVVRGADRLTADEVLAAAEVERGDAIVWLDERAGGAGRGAAVGAPGARSNASGPDTLRITVAERRAVAWFDAGNGAASLVDGTGHVLATDPGRAGRPAAAARLAAGTPVGGTITPIDGARVAGMLDGFVQAGSRAVEVVDGRRDDRDRIGPGDPHGASRPRSPPRSAPRSRCSVRRGGGQALRRRERPVHPGGRRVRSTVASCV